MHTFFLLIQELVITKSKNYMLNFFLNTIYLSQTKSILSFLPIQELIIRKSKGYFKFYAIDLVNLFLS